MAADLWQCQVISSNSKDYKQIFAFLDSEHEKLAHFNKVDYMATDTMPSCITRSSTTTVTTM